MVILGFCSQRFNVKMMQEKYFGLFLVAFFFGVLFRFWLDVMLISEKCSLSLLILGAPPTSQSFTQGLGKPKHHSHFPGTENAKLTPRGVLAALVSPRRETSFLGDIWAAQNCIYVPHSSEDIPEIPTHSQDRESSPDNFNWVGSHWEKGSLGAEVLLSSPSSPR